MFSNYILVAFRNLKRHRFFSCINIFGLAIAMSICLGIIMLVADQLTYDRHNSAASRIFRIDTRILNPDGSLAGNEYATTPQPMAESLLKDYTGVENAVRIRRGFGNNWIEFDQDVNVPVAGFYVDHSFLEVFENHLKYGNEKTALLEPYSVVLTEKCAQKLFDIPNPVGQIIKVGDLGEYKVTGVIKDNGYKSHIAYEALASYATIESLEASKKFDKGDSKWQNFTAGWVYVKLQHGIDEEAVAAHLNAIAEKVHPGRNSSEDNHKYSFYLQNLRAITPGPFINNAIGPFMPRIFVYFLAGLALIIMLTSCFNYTNLSIARSLTRAREIGVRKVNGANRFQVFFQFISESVLLSLFALIGAVSLLVAVKPLLMNLRFAQIFRWDLEGNIYVYGVFVVFSIVIGIIAGFFPAVVLSNFQPIKVLKSAGNLKLFSRMGLRKFLLTFQFTLTLIFVISVLLLNNQLDLFLSASHGFEMRDKIIVRLNDTDPDNLKAELLRNSAIVNVSASSHVPAAGITYGDAFKKQVSDPESHDMDYFYVDENYLDNMGINLVAGKNFQDAEARESVMLINESAVQKFQFGSPQQAVGEFIYDARDSAKYEIIGVVKDYNHQVLMSKIGPMALRVGAKDYHLLQIKYQGDQTAAKQAIQAAWAKVNPTFKLDIIGFEEEIKRFYETLFSDLVNIIGVVSFLAIIISCLGLLGMATYTTETRLKEITIRKVLGSTSQSLVLLISRGFVFLLLIAVAIGVPLAWFINNLWMEHVAYKTPFSLRVVGLGVSVVFILALLTIGSQTLKAAFADPAKSLRND
jgi:putative ABC transport system permease protein